MRRTFRFPMQSRSMYAQRIPRLRTRLFLNDRCQPQRAGALAAGE
jgi:hypothetical protein